MSTLATRVNALKPTAAEIGDVDSILRKAREADARRRASYLPPKPKVDAKPPKYKGKRDIIDLSLPNYVADLQKEAEEKAEVYDLESKKQEELKRGIDIVREVAEKFQVSLIDLLSARRTANIVIPRHYAMWRCRKETFMSLPAIGRLFRRDHTVAFYAVEKIEKLIAEGKLEALIEEAGK